MRKGKSFRGNVDMTNKIILMLLFLVNFFMLAQSDSNRLDDKGNKDGLWKGYFAETKNLKYEGTFEHGKEVGVFTYYDNKKTKIIVATREFNPKDNSAYTIFYDPIKNKVSEGKLVNKVYEGEWKYYHKASKNIMSTENYTNGKLEGLRSVFYPSGKLAEETFYKNNMKNGPYKRYTETGIIIEESNYKNNQFDGLAIFRDPDDGTIASKGKFTDGKKTGIWQFFQKGKLVKEENMSFQQSISNSKK
jgi:antitoxin component YwqK of YwqJK toxin-antitoxin module